MQKTLKNFQREGGRDKDTLYMRHHRSRISLKKIDCEAVRKSTISERERPHTHKKYTISKEWMTPYAMLSRFTDKKEDIISSDFRETKQIQLSCQICKDDNFISIHVIGLLTEQNFSPQICQISLFGMRDETIDEAKVFSIFQLQALRLDDRVHHIYFLAPCLNPNEILHFCGEKKRERMMKYEEVPFSFEEKKVASKKFQHSCFSIFGI